LEESSSASFVGLIGAIYGRIPKFLKEPSSYIGGSG